MSSKYTCRLSVLIGVAGMLVALAVFGGSAALAQRPAIEDQCGHASAIAACPSLCARACTEPSFRQRFRAACQQAMLRSGTKDPDSCGQPQGVTPVQARGPTPSATVRPSETLEQIRTRCAREFPPPPPSPIPNKGPKPPECFVTMRNLECRFEGLNRQGIILKDQVQPIASRKYPDRKTKKEICELKKEDVEGDYQKAGTIKEPLQRLQDAFREEQSCMSGYKAAMEEGINCEGRKALCDLRKQTVRDEVNQELQKSETTSKDVVAAADAAKEAISDIEDFWPFFQSQCM